MSAPYSIVAYKEVNNDYNMYGLFISPDGLHAYQFSRFSNKLYSYTFSSPWSVPSLVYTGSSGSLDTNSSGARGIYFNDDGTRLFLLHSTTNVSEYSLSTPWDVSTIAYVKKKTLTTALYYGFTFNITGSKMYTISGDPWKLNEYDLSTAFDIATAVLTHSVVITFNPVGLWLSEDGKKLYSIYSGYALMVNELSIAFDITTGSFVNDLILYDIPYPYPPVGANQYGIFFKRDESRMYLLAEHVTYGGFYIFENNSTGIIPPLFWTNFHTQSEIL